MEDQQECIMKEMEETRTSLTEKLEALETQVSEKVQPVADAVERVSEAAAEIVENVKETVHKVSEKVGETVESVSSAFSLRKQTERHPWIVFAAAATTGCMIAYFGRRSRRNAEASRPLHTPRKHGKLGGNGASHHFEPAPVQQAAGSSQQPSWLSDEFQHFRGLALSTVMGVVRNIALKAFEGQLGRRIGEEIDSLTTRMGASPFQGPVLPEHKKRRQQEGQGLEQGKESPIAEGNRMRSEAWGQG